MDYGVRTDCDCHDTSIEEFCAALHYAQKAHLTLRKGSGTLCQLWGGQGLSIAGRDGEETCWSGKKERENMRTFGRSAADPP